ncbi:TolC family protein [Nitratiruptor tergarcus]|uniref:Outer membrane protein n=1 Tax=Nitratiruptor tergarcus DSM 16512 TaxID=1069081 RepID=A0A1W1WS02_9BACT|nr:TolC family protein [Nitratiruptor tergarcus]SMC08790.1 Outer membrane protein [Nitratiruptor tergarcus DSM 16512]
MKKMFVLSVAAFVTLQASQLQELFKALKTKPVTEVDRIAIDIVRLQKQKVQDSLYPEFNLFASYEYYNRDTNLRPVPPPEANRRIAKKEPLPFAKNIQRIGGMFSMPLFVKKLFTLQKKLDFLIEAAKLKKDLDIYKNEAILLASYANLNYLKDLKRALKARKASLLKTYEDVKIKVESGRAAPIALDKIESVLDSLDIALENVKANEAKAKEAIESLTGVAVSQIEPIVQKNAIEKNDLFVLKLFDQKIKAQRKDVEASKDEFVPKLILQGSYTKDYAQDDVMFDKSIDTDYGSLALKLIIPLSKANLTQIEIAKTALLKEQKQKAQTKLELQAQAKSLQKQLAFNERAQKLAQKKVRHQEELLRYAKTAYDVGRLTQEEYLRYEEALLDAEANLASLKAKKWQIVGKLAVIYGNDLERIVK